jgi:replicative DNA helicase
MALYSIQVEKHALCGLIQNPDLIPDIESFLSEKDFSVSPHNVIFSCLRSAFLNHEKIDKVLLAQKIQDIGISFKEDIDIFSYIDSISFAPITKEATIDACKELVKFKILRDLEETADRIKTYVNKAASQPIEKTILEVDAIYGEKINGFDVVKEPEELFFDIYEMIEERGNNPIDEIGLSTPYPEFNRLYGGLRGGNIYAIASRPKQGKTTWLNHMACETGRMHNLPVLILDTEMSTQEIKFRTAAGFSGVPLWYLETGNWRKNPEYAEKVRKYLKNIKTQYKVYHYHVGNKPVDEVCALIRRWYLHVVGRGNRCIVAYDYLKLTGEKLSNNWAEHQALGEKVDKFKRISIEYNFPLLSAIQLNRSGENTGRQSNNVTDDSSAIAISDRLQWFTTYLGIFRRKTEDELILDTLESGTHKLIEIAARFQGKDAAGHRDFILREFPDGSKKYVRNYINFDVDNFNVAEKGSLRDSIQRQNAQFLVEDPNQPSLAEDTL